MTTFALITGGVGFLGSHIAQELIKKSLVEKVVLLDHFGRYVDSASKCFKDYRALRLSGIEDKIIIERGEARFAALVYRLLEVYRPLYIFHLASLPLSKLHNLNTEEAREGSVDATSIILEMISEIRRLHGYSPRRFIFASSSMVYGDFLEDPAKEEHPTRPKEIYGAMKLAGEAVTSGLGRYFEVPWTIIRPTAVYGPTDMNRRVSQIFVEKALRGEPLTIHGANEALDFTFVRDVASGFILAATSESANGEVFNIARGSASTLLQFALTLKEHFPELRYEVAERDTFRPKRGTLSIEKARLLLGYEPRYSLKAGIAEYVAFLRRHGN